jgi:protein-S-isoprenylcysteine O-methyltransferase Ste14
MKSPGSTTQGSFRERGGYWVIGQSALMLSVVVLGVAFHGDGSETFQAMAGAILFILGGAIGLAGVAVLGRSRTPYPQPRPDAVLIQRGIYAWIRHPLYTSVMLASLGWALIWQSGLALGAALLLIPFFDAKARREERWLAERFAEYGDYQRRVRRFVPWIY